MRTRVFTRSQPVTVTVRQRAPLNFTYKSRDQPSPHRCKRVLFIRCWAVDLVCFRALFLMMHSKITFYAVTVVFSSPLGLNWRRCRRSRRSRRSQRMRWSVSLCLTSSNPFMTWMWSRERRPCSNVKWLVCLTPPSSGSTTANGLRAPRTEGWHSVSVSKRINIRSAFRPLWVYIFTDFTEILQSWALYFRFS